jgi:hypothetical protein
MGGYLLNRLTNWTALKRGVRENFRPPGPDRTQKRRGRCPLAVSACIS